MAIGISANFFGQVSPAVRDDQYYHWNKNVIAIKFKYCFNPDSIYNRRVDENR